MQNSSLPKLVLYIGATCPYCQKVLKFMESNNIKLEVVDVWQDDKKGEAFRLASGGTQVPCLQIDADYMRESDDIIKKLSTLFNL